MGKSIYPSMEDDCGVPSCCVCGMNAFDGREIDGKTYCLDHYIEKEHGGKDYRDLPEDLQSVIFD